MEMGLKQAKKIVIDLGLVIECKEEELLPERLLCVWRMCRPDLTQTVNIDWGVCLMIQSGGEVLIITVVKQEPQAFTYSRVKCLRYGVTPVISLLSAP